MITENALICGKGAYLAVIKIMSLGYNKDFSLYRQLLNASDAAEIEPQIAVRSGQWDFLAAMVAAGIGIAVLPEPLCQRLR